jgi:hypothetical protein
VCLAGVGEGSKAWRAVYLCGVFAILD